MLLYITFYKLTDKKDFILYIFNYQIISQKPLISHKIHARQNSCHILFAIVSDGFYYFHYKKFNLRCCRHNWNYVSWFLSITLLFFYSLFFCYSEVQKNTKMFCLSLKKKSFSSRNCLCCVVYWIFIYCFLT